MTQTTWATEQDVSDLTDVSVTAAQLAQAQATIDLHAGRFYDDRERIGTRDQHWLKYAVAYQAAWLPAHPDVFQRIEITQDGTGASSTQFPPDALVLAPFAARALNRVSWLRSRSLHVRSPMESTTSDDDDDVELGWSPWEQV